MGCGVSSPAEVPEGPAPAAADPPAASSDGDKGASAGPPPGFGMLKRSTRATSGHSADRERYARLALATAVKRQCGYVPVFYIRSQFDAYDTDKSGFLEVNELVKMLSDLQEEVDGDLAALGLENQAGTGGVDFETFKTWYIQVLTPHKVKMLFESYDEDKNGGITPEEIQALLQDLSEDSDKESCANAMQAMDANEDGRITLDEFTKYFLGAWARDQLRGAFDNHSVDVDSEVDKEMLKETLDRMGAQLEDSAMDYMFDKLDAGKTGKVNFAKFIEYASYNV